MVLWLLKRPKLLIKPLVHLKIELFVIVQPVLLINSGLNTPIEPDGFTISVLVRIISPSFIRLASLIFLNLPPLIFKVLLLSFIILPLLLKVPSVIEITELLLKTILLKLFKSPFSIIREAALTSILPSLLSIPLVIIISGLFINAFPVCEKLLIIINPLFLLFITPLLIVDPRASSSIIVPLFIIVPSLCKIP